MQARTAALNSDINVTPLVDVCLVLLIIFMVVLPSLVNGVPVELPTTSGAANVDERILPVTIKEDGTVYLDTLIVRRDEVESALQRFVKVPRAARSACGRTSAFRTERSSAYSTRAARRDGKT